MPLYGSAPDATTGLKGKIQLAGDLSGTADAPLIANGVIDPEDLVTGAGTTWVWPSWTPTWTNLTIGNGTSEYGYIKTGKTVIFRIFIQLGSTSSISGDVTYTLPSTARTVTFPPAIGMLRIRDSGVATYAGQTEMASATTGNLRVYNAAGTYLTSVACSATIPMTWATNDTIHIWGCYEEA